MSDRHEFHFGRAIPKVCYLVSSGDVTGPDGIQMGTVLHRDQIGKHDIIATYKLVSVECDGREENIRDPRAETT